MFLFSKGSGAWKEIQKRKLTAVSSANENLASLSDIMDGREYKRLCLPGEFLSFENNMSLVLYTDGVLLHRSSKIEFGIHGNKRVSRKNEVGAI